MGCRGRRTPGCGRKGCGQRHRSKTVQRAHGRGHCRGCDPCAAMGCLGAGGQDSGHGFQRLGHAEGRGELELRETGCRTRGKTSDRGKGVSNLITVKPSTTPSELKKTIEDALVRNAKVDANKITVEVQGSKAILKGAVRAWVEKEEAERVAWLAPGVTSVENRITVDV